MTTVPRFDRTQAHGLQPVGFGKCGSARLRLLTFVLGLLAASPLSAAENLLDCRDFGAQPDGKTLCTAAIQKAIDACAAKGGGTVYLPPGTLRSGTIYLKSNVTLLLESGCTLLGSASLDDYPRNVPAVRSYTDNYVDRSLIAGENLENVAIRGCGTIDGSGGRFRWSQYLTRPYAIRLVRCRGVLIEGVTLRDSAMWMQHYLACDRVTVHGITVHNHATHNNDGLDLDGCHDATVSDCCFDSDDDAITLKSTLGRACENITITNCIAASRCSAIKMGTESNGGFKNITIANCVIRAPSGPQRVAGDGRREKEEKGRRGEAETGRRGEEENRRGGGTVVSAASSPLLPFSSSPLLTFSPSPATQTIRGLAGIALEIVDGGELDRVAINNITITGVSVPLFMRLGNRARPFAKDGPKPAIGTFRNVTVSNVIATGASKIGCSITGLPGHPIENCSLSNLNFAFDGGGQEADASRQVPELPERYPECTMFGTLPAYGLYCRHVKDLRAQNVQLRAVGPEVRKAMILDDVAEVRVEGLDAGRQR